MSPSNKNQSTPRPGAMSLLDKYAQINQNIEEARKRVTATRSTLESTSQSIETLQSRRSTMESDTALAKDELSQFEREYKQVEASFRLKMDEKRRIEGEHRLAQRECNDAKRQIETERMSFLERCREFRSSCKRMKVAATILVLDGGGGGLDESASGYNVWRKLREDYGSDDEGVGSDKHNSLSLKKKVDFELEKAITEEKENREAFIEAECALHTARSKLDEAVQRCNARNQKLTQQRAQLERHRREVEELEREIHQVKDETVKANQDAKGYEVAWKRGKTPYNGGCYNSNNQSNNGSYSSHFNPPSNRNNYTPLHNSSSSTNRSSSNVSNPYKSKPSNPYQNSSGNQGSHNGRTTASSHQYASEMLRKTGDNASTGHQTQSYGSTSQKTQTYGSTTHQTQSYGSTGQQHQKRTWSSARNQRQFGTAVDISVDYSTSTSPKFSASKSSHRVSLHTPLSSAGDDNSSVSSASSGDDIISFDIFGKGK